MTGASDEILTLHGVEPMIKDTDYSSGSDNSVTRMERFVQTNLYGEKTI